MTTVSQRIAVGNPQGARSLEWIIMWKTTASDVYVATRALGGIFKASIHERGQCHIKGPGVKHWGSPGTPPWFLDTWSIDPQAIYVFPFSIIIPEPELRAGEWAKHKDKGTIWLPVEKGKGIEVAIFLLRSNEDQSNALSLKAAGRSRT